MPKPDGEPLGVAIVGSGFMGRVHADAARTNGAVIRGVGVRSPERADDAMRTVGANHAYCSPAEVAGATDVDVVHICTPNATHFAYATAAIEAGKHVICEKPLGISYEQADELTALAANAGVVATVPFVYRYYPTVREAATRARSGDLGAVRLIHGSYLQDWLSDLATWNWRADTELGGPSRAFADIGIHWCDLAEFVTGDRIARLCARMSYSHERDSHNGDHPTPTEDAVLILFETEQGATGNVTISQVSHGQKNHLHLEVDGGLGSVVFDQERPDLLLVSHRHETRVLRQGGSELSAIANHYSRVPVGHPQGYTDCFALFVRDTYDAIRGEQPVGMPRFADGLRAATLVDAVLESVSTDGWVQVTAPMPDTIW